jgi:hypothetical protein
MSTETTVRKAVLIATALACLITANGFANPDPVSSPPQGDQHVAILAQELDDLLSANNLFKRCIDQDRPGTEAVSAANALADSYDRLCSHLAQFYSWIQIRQKSGKPSDFSTEGQQRLTELSGRLHTVLTDSVQDIIDALGKKPQYAHDPGMVAAWQRMIASSNRLTNLKGEADKQ